MSTTTLPEHAQHGRIVRSNDVARILPFSKRQIQAMAAKGRLGAFKVPGCSAWCFHETVVLAAVSIYSSGLPLEPVTPSCRRRISRPTPTVTCSSAVTPTTSATNLAGPHIASRLAHLISRRRGKPATASSPKSSTDATASRSQ